MAVKVAGSVVLLPKRWGVAKARGGNDVFYHNFIAQTVYNIYTQFTFQ